MWKCQRLQKGMEYKIYKIKCIEIAGLKYIIDWNMNYFRKPSFNFVKIYWLDYSAKFEILWVLFTILEWALEYFIGGVNEKNLIRAILLSS